MIHIREFVLCVTIIMHISDLNLKDAASQFVIDRRLAIEHSHKTQKKKYISSIGNSFAQEIFPLK